MGQAGEGVPGTEHGLSGCQQGWGLQFRALRPGGRWLPPRPECKDRMWLLRGEAPQDFALGCRSWVSEPLLCSQDRPGSKARGGSCAALGLAHAPPISEDGEGTRWL